LSVRTAYKRPPLGHFSFSRGTQCSCAFGFPGMIGILLNVGQVSVNRNSINLDGGPN
jgi:hypothetical protein